MATTRSRSGGPARAVSGRALPPALDHLGGELERSRRLLDLADDWDDEGSPGYDEATWDRAIGLLVRIATTLWDDHGIAVDGGDVFPGSHSNIDFELRTPGRRLLVSVPPEPGVPARYFGQDTTEVLKIKGQLEIGHPTGRLVAWLAG